MNTLEYILNEDLEIPKDYDYFSEILDEVLEEIHPKVESLIKSIKGKKVEVTSFTYYTKKETNKSITLYVVPSGKTISSKGKIDWRIEFIKVLYDNLKYRIPEELIEFDESKNGKITIYFDKKIYIYVKPDPPEKARASDLEETICSIWNDRFGHNHSYNVTKEYENDANMTVNKLSTIISTEEKAYRYGGGYADGVEGPIISNLWKRFSERPNSTPKTDIIIGDNKISVKHNTNQIMSGNVLQGDGDATIKAVLEANTSLSNNISNDLKNRLSNIFNDPDLANNIEKKNIDIETVSKVQAKITNELNEILNNNTEIKKYILYEGLTGELKFKNDPPVANKILVVKENNIIFKDIDLNYVESLLNRVEIKVTHKSGGGVSRSVLRITDNLKESLDFYLTEKNILNKLMNKFKEILNKGLVPFLARFNIDFNLNIE